MRVAVYLRTAGLLTEHYAIRQAESLASYGHEVKLFSLVKASDTSLSRATHASFFDRKSWSSKLYESLSVRLAVRTHPWSGGYLDPLSSTIMRARFDEFQPDVVYSMYGNYAVDLLDICGTKYPIVIHFAGSDISSVARKPLRYQNSIKRLAANATQILCGSEFLSAKAREFGISQSKVRRHYIGIDVGEAGTQGRDGNIMVVGRLVPVKGVDLSLRVFAQANVETARLLVCGDGPERPHLIRLANELGIRSRVDFLGSVPNHAVRELLKKSSALLQMNRTTSSGQAEGLGGTILEASAAGTAVVACASGGVREALPADIDVVAEGSIELASATLRRLLKSPAEAWRAGEAGRDFVVTHHNALIQDKTLETVMLNCIDMSKGASVGNG